MSRVFVAEEIALRRRVVASVSQALTRRVILWCVEAYFGQLGATAQALARANCSRTIAPRAQLSRLCHTFS
jgi:hypothetical protein